MKWSITNCQVKPWLAGYSDVVVFCNFTLMDNKGSMYGSVQEAVNLLPPKGSFIPFSEIKEAQMVEWVREALGAERIKALELNVTAQIQQQEIPDRPEQKPLPWKQDEAKAE
jgi:hypothetical protein